MDDGQRTKCSRQRNILTVQHSQSCNLIAYHNVRDGSDKMLVAISVRLYDIHFRHVELCNECVVNSSTLKRQQSNKGFAFHFTIIVLVCTCASCLFPELYSKVTKGCASQSMLYHFMLHFDQLYLGH